MEVNAMNELVVGVVLYLLVVPLSSCHSRLRSRRTGKGFNIASSTIAVFGGSMFVIRPDGS